MRLLKSLYFTFTLILAFVGGYLVRDFTNTKLNKLQIPEKVIEKLKPLERYSIENLSKSEIKPGKINIKDLLNEGENFNSYLFEFEFNPNLDGKGYKKTTGQINLPTGRQVFLSNSETSQYKYPIIVMIRGFINQDSYKTGDGTRNAAKFFAENGFITVAPDFLGYGDSDKEANDIFESRFQTYVTILSLLKTIEQMGNSPNLISLPDNLTIKPFNNPQIFLWSHSNGGQIALTTLEVSSATYPTVLWAPVSKPFPYSILYYTDESDDHGKFIRKELAEFEELYDVEKYSITNYLDKIKVPIFIQQGTGDEAVPEKWSIDLHQKLNDISEKPDSDPTIEGKSEMEIKLYPGADHNMRPAWNDVVIDDLDFFKKHMNN